jgi:uroporphyrin-III C-methyltransferase/precorrin-2 dehydrogenase/sirohydrochlorin ferrochelatase
VALIGCGPGDPELLTIKALHRIREADVLIIDRLVSPQILALARGNAQLFAVGKFPGGPATTQAAINALLLRHARAGRRVARLKGGDPLIFGRACEEIAALAAAGIPCEVIPGVTAAQACAARVGLPLTVRGRVRHLTIATAASAGDGPALAWEMLARPDCAAAIYMGVGAAGTLRRELLAAGCRRDTPIVIVENGTLASERAVASTLEELQDCVRALHITAPCVIFLGLAWSKAGLARPDGVGVFRSRGLQSLEQRRPAVNARGSVVREPTPSFRSRRPWSQP